MTLNQKLDLLSWVRLREMSNVPLSKTELAQATLKFVLSNKGEPLALESAVGVESLCETHKAALEIIVWLSPVPIVFAIVGLFDNAPSPPGPPAKLFKFSLGFRAPFGDRARKDEQFLNTMRLGV